MEGASLRDRLVTLVIWTARLSSDRISHVDWVLLLPLSFALLTPLGLLCGGFATYHYLRWERFHHTPSLPVALAAFVLQYGFVFASARLSSYRLLPTILMFLTTLALVTAIRLGLQAHSRAGARIALAALFTLSAYVCKMGSDYYLLPNFHR